MARFTRGAKNLASREKAGKDLTDWLYRYALSRPPTVKEQAVLSEIVGDGRDPVAVEDLLWTVFMLHEFQIIR